MKSSSKLACFMDNPFARGCPAVEAIGRVVCESHRQVGPWRYPRIAALNERRSLHPSAAFRVHHHLSLHLSPADDGTRALDRRFSDTRVTHGASEVPRRCAVLG